MAQTGFTGDKVRRQFFSLLGIFITFFFWIGSLLFLLLNFTILSWDRLWRWFGVWNLVMIRFIMRKRNLYDTSKLPPANPPETDPRALPWNPAYQHERTADGTFNDLDHPLMGCAGARFGRNFPLTRLPDRFSLEQDIQIPHSRFWNPSPRLVSRRFLTRDRFRPAKTLNLLAAAWIQFQVHDWANHERSCTNYHPDIRLDQDDPWPSPDPGIMRIRRSEQDRPPATRTPGPTDLPDPPTFRNTETHWWDSSQLYGSSLGRQHQLRLMDGTGKLRMDRQRLLPEVAPLLGGIDLTGFNDNWWVGLSLFHTLFALEHNAICDCLARAYPDWREEELFQKARLINSALIAKIHTLEWTPAILGHPTLQIGMRANWWGIMTEGLTKAFGRVKTLPGIQEEISGIPGSEKDHGPAPYAITEEFVTVYRLHPLIPDDYRFYSATTDELLEELAFNDIQGRETRPCMDRIAMEDLLYSFGVAHPGAITLKNFPRALQQFTRIADCDGTIENELLDLGTVDILRDRERAIPRYNEFRRLLWRLPVCSFERLVGLPLLFPWFTGLTKREKKERKDLAKELEKAYVKVEDLDTMIGLLGEKLPKGFGFSDTAFRIFILMASRRLKSDRFFTDDFMPKVYTPVGYQWINSNGLKSVLQRHFPALTAVMDHDQNVFAPWSRVEMPAPEPMYLQPGWFEAKAIMAGATTGAVLGGGAAFSTTLTEWGTNLLQKFGNLSDLPSKATFALSNIGDLLTSVMGWATVGAGLAVFCLAVFHLSNDRRSREITPRGRAAIAALFAVFGGVVLAGYMFSTGKSPLTSFGPILTVWIGAGFGWTAGVALVKYVPWLGPSGLPAGRVGCSLSVDQISGAVFAGLFGAVVGWMMGVVAHSINEDVITKIIEGFNSAHVYWICVGTGIGAFLGLIDRGRIGLLVGAVIGAGVGFIGFLISLLFWYPGSLSIILGAILSPMARWGLWIGLVAGALLIVLSERFRWRIRRWFWSAVVWIKFRFNKKLKFRTPKEMEKTLTPIPLRERFRGIPIPPIPPQLNDILVADSIPADERSCIKQLFYWIQIKLYSYFSPMQAGLPSIDKDPQKALNQAYRRGRRRLFDPPELPPEFEGSPDLGNLAVRGPYACYLRKVQSGEYAGDFEWNLLELNDLNLEEDYHEGLYPLGVRVLFQRIPDHRAGNPTGVSSRLRAYQIEYDRRITQPDNPDWELAKRIALCAVTTHLSLVRHFNWVHLATGEPLAIATRNSLPPNHPLCRLLWPHIYGTQQSNAIVTPGQMVKGGDFDSIFSFTHRGMCRLFAQSFNDSSLDVNDPAVDGGNRDILNQGFATPTQQNLEQLFEVFLRHAERYVNFYYPSDAEVAADPGINDWLRQLDRLIPNGIGSVVNLASVTREGLGRLIARFIYLVSVQHEIVGTFLWNYQLWTHRQPARVYTDGRREPLDVYERLVNANYNLNVTRAELMADYSNLALDQPGKQLFKDFQDDLTALQKEMEKEVWAIWKIYPKILEVNINA